MEIVQNRWKLFNYFLNFDQTIANCVFSRYPSSLSLSLSIKRFRYSRVFREIRFVRKQGQVNYLERATRIKGTSARHLFKSAGTIKARPSGVREATNEYRRTIRGSSKTRRSEKTKEDEKRKRWFTVPRNRVERQGSNHNVVYGERGKKEGNVGGRASFAWQRRSGEGICVSVGRRDLIRACRVSLEIVGKCLLSQENAVRRESVYTLADERSSWTLLLRYFTRRWIPVSIFRSLFEQSEFFFPPRWSASAMEFRNRLVNEELGTLRVTAVRQSSTNLSRK